jgi:hypothetical protein
MNMFVSSGWFCLVGGVLSAVGVATIKKFFLSDCANSDGVIKQEDYTAEVRLTPMERWIIVGICALVAVAGALIVQHDFNWNPFQ